MKKGDAIIADDLDAFCVKRSLRQPGDLHEEGEDRLAPDMIAGERAAPPRKAPDGVFGDQRRGGGDIAPVKRVEQVSRQLRRNRHPPASSPASYETGLAGASPLAYLPRMPGFDDILADFAFLDDWDDRYKYLIDLGRSLDPYPEEKRDDAHKVKGCASQVWLDITRENGVLTLRGDSDAHIVKGLVALLIALYSGKSPAEILSADAEKALAPLDLTAHLTPQRSNGVASMIARIRAVAAEASAR